MAKKRNAPKNPKEDQMPPLTQAPPDKHKTRKMVRVEDKLHALFQQLAKRNDRPMSREIRSALIAHLRANGLWPPPGES